MLNEQHVRSALAAIPGGLGGQVKSLAELAAGANDALRQAPPGLTVAGAAAFLATMAQESAWFRTTEEYAKNGRYAPYIGRTFEQITWKDNYRAFGVWLKAKGLIADSEQFVKDPKSLADYRWAWLGGVWYFEANNLWSYANRGDFLAVQRGVNLGNPLSKTTPAGWKVRKAIYDAFMLVGSNLLPEPVIVVPPVAENVGIWVVDPGEVQTTLYGRRGKERGNELSPGTTINDGVRFEFNDSGRPALLRANGWSYDRGYLLQIGPGPVPVTRQFPVIPDYDKEEKVKFRGGVTCRCVAISLPWVEYMMLDKGLIKFNLDIYQLGYRNDVEQSAGTHARGGNTDSGQYSDAQIAAWRMLGWTMQHRTPAQGFSHHAHGWPKGCQHLSPGAKAQALAWDRGKDGLIQNRSITGADPKGKATKRWDIALSAYMKSVGAPPIAGL